MSSLGTSDAGGKGKEMHTLGASSLPPLTILSDPSSHARCQALSLTLHMGGRSLEGSQVPLLAPDTCVVPKRLFQIQLPPHV